VIRRLAKTLLGDYWRHTCLRCTSARSALRRLRNALYKFSTCLLTYLLIWGGLSWLPVSFWMHENIIYCIVLCPNSKYQFSSLLTYLAYLLLNILFSLWFLLIGTPLPSNRHHWIRNNGDCLTGKRENYQVCSVQYCLQQLHTVRYTHIWTDLTGLWLRFCLNSMYFLYVCILHACVVL